jgi:hypothetical protein
MMNDATWGELMLFLIWLAGCLLSALLAIQLTKE